jgi:hypothetical protein
VSQVCLCVHTQEAGGGKPIAAYESPHEHRPPTVFRHTGPSTLQLGKVDNRAHPKHSLGKLPQQMRFAAIYVNCMTTHGNRGQIVLKFGAEELLCS